MADSAMDARGASQDVQRRSFATLRGPETGGGSGSQPTRVVLTQARTMLGSRTPWDQRSTRSARQTTRMDSQQLTAVQQATIARRVARQRWIEAVHDAQAAGASLRQIAEVAGVSAGYLSRVLRGQRLAR
jgi:hypothetical protein